MKFGRWDGWIGVACRVDFNAEGAGFAEQK
jgi:hypothetical protein